MAVPERMRQIRNMAWQANESKGIQILIRNRFGINVGDVSEAVH